MAKTKLRNFRNSVTLVRPDGSEVSYAPGLQEVSTETYDVGKVKDADGNEKDHPLKGKSDYSHWHIEGNSDAVETKAERDAAEAAAASQTVTVLADTAPQAAKADGKIADAKDAGNGPANA